MKDEYVSEDRQPDDVDTGEEAGGDHESQAQPVAEVAPTEGNSVLGPPPLPDSGQTQVNVGVAVLQSMPSLDRLDKEIQHRILDIAQQMDNNSFKNATNWLEHKTELRQMDIADANRGRKHVLVFAGTLATLVILAGTSVTIVLIMKNQPQLAQTVMLAGLSSIGMFLGGTGIWGVLQTLRGRRGSGDS